MENNDILSFNTKTEQFHVKTAPQSVERKPTPNASNLASAPADNNAPIAQQPDVDFVERLTQHLSELNSVVDSFQNDHGKVAAEFQAAQTEVNRLKSELFHSENKLAELAAKGSALQQYSAAVSRVEGSYQRTLADYSDSVYADVIRHIFGRDIPTVKLSSERKAELKLHARIDALRQFTFIPQSDMDKRFDGSTRRIVTTPRVELTNKRVEAVGEKLIALKTHISAQEGK
jgi:septal ring factor EnvC (AmiA/AmiB activator)